MPLVERKALLERLIAGTPGLQFNAHEMGEGEIVRKHACKLGFEGVVSKTIDAPYAPGNRGLWRKSKYLNRQEFVIVGWTDPEGSRPQLGALLLGYYTDDGKLIYAGRVQVHWVEPRIVAEITYLSWTADGLLQQTVYVGLRADKPATEVRREIARR